MPRKNFQSELEELHDEFIKMGECIERSIEMCIESFRTGNAEMAQQVCDNDHEINNLEKSVQSKALILLLRQQPVASDLRRVTSSLKIATDMERIGDQCADIAEMVLRIVNQGKQVNSSRFEEISKLSAYMVKACVRAFACEDTELAEVVIDTDNKVDELFNSIKKDLVTTIKNVDDSHEDVDTCIDLLMIAKHFEKIGDYAVNIAEWTGFCETGVLDHVRIL